MDNFVSKTAAYDTGIGKNHFSKDRIILDIRSESFSIKVLLILAAQHLGQ